MMEIKVTVVLPGIPEAINNLANAISKQAVVMNATEPAVSTAPNAEADKIDGSSISATPAVEQPVTEPVEATPTVAPVAEEATAPATPAPIPQTPAANPVLTRKYTREEIANAGSALVTQGKMNDLLALLNKYGVQSVAHLPEDQYGAFAEDLKALGAAL